MYTYEVAGDPPICRIYAGPDVIDESGPWESTEASETLALAYTNKLNDGLVSPEQPT